jgi:hypothetical protein
VLAARALFTGPLAALLLTLSLGSAPAEAAGPEGGLDSRAWELVSPVGSGEAQAGSPEDDGAGAFQAAAGGGSLAFGADASFAEGEGAPPVSQYLAERGAGGWVTANLSPPMLSGTYAGGAYQLFSTDLSRALLSNGWICREGGSACAAQNPPLSSDAPPGYRTLYLRAGGGYHSLLTAANSPSLTVSPQDFELSLAGATPDLRHAVISTCAALTPDAVEVAAPGGCDPAATNLYEWSEGTLTALNLLPGQAQTAPGASLAAPAGAISADGSRVYWTRAGALYLREGATTEAVAPAGVFQAAAADGSSAFYTEAAHLHRFDAVAETSDDLTPGGGVQGVLGASPGGTHVYYLTSSGLFLWHGGSTTEAAAGADLSNVPPATGTARVSADGNRLAFLSSASLTGYPNAGHAQVYLYEAAADHLACISCNPKGTPPIGPSTIPGAHTAAEGPAAYKPRALSAAGTRLFFDSADALTSPDTDGEPDVYEWEAQGTGSCTAAAGCLALVSYGRTGADFFLDAGADGTDAFFLTPVSLVGADRGGVDVYDARAGGGFPEPPLTVPCEGDTCQALAPAPNDPAPGTAIVKSAGNPAPRFVQSARAKKRPDKKKNKHKQKKQGHRGSQKGGRS